MSKNHTYPLKYGSFEDFYNNRLTQFKAQNPTFTRLDGLMSGSSQNAFAYFIYQNKCWRIDADCSIEKLDLAYSRLLIDNEVLIEKPTRKNKNICLEIKGEPSFKKLFYVYLTALSVE